MSGLFEGVTTGASGGFIGTLLGYFTASREIKQVEKKVDTVEEKIEKLQERIVFKDTCNVCSGNTQNKLDYIIKRLDEHCEGDRK